MHLLAQNLDKLQLEYNNVQRKQLNSFDFK